MHVWFLFLYLLYFYLSWFLLVFILKEQFPHVVIDSFYFCQGRLTKISLYSGRTLTLWPKWMIAESQKWTRCCLKHRKNPNPPSHDLWTPHIYPLNPAVGFICAHIMSPLGIIHELRANFSSHPLPSLEQVMNQAGPPPLPTRLHRAGSDCSWQPYAKHAWLWCPFLYA